MGTPNSTDAIHSLNMAWDDEIRCLVDRLQAEIDDLRFQVLRLKAKLYDLHFGEEVLAMPVRKAKGGWKVGSGKAVYDSKATATKVNQAIHSRKNAKKDKK
jgi:hypothetical protein